MTPDDWKHFIKVAHNVAKKHINLFQTDDINVIEEYLSFHQLHGNLHFVCNKEFGNAFMVIHPVVSKDNEFDWTQPDSGIFMVDVFYSESKSASKQILKQIIASDRKIHKAYSYRKGRTVPWDVRVIKKFLYGQKESSITPSSCS
jgi:hypothetical protein